MTDEWDATQRKRTRGNPGTVWPVSVDPRNYNLNDVGLSSLMLTADQMHPPSGRPHDMPTVHEGLPTRQLLGDLHLHGNLVTRRPACGLPASRGRVQRRVADSGREDVQVGRQQRLGDLQRPPAQGPAPALRVRGRHHPQDHPLVTAPPPALPPRPQAGPTGAAVLTLCPLRRAGSGATSPGAPRGAWTRSGSTWASWPRRSRRS